MLEGSRLPRTPLIESRSRQGRDDPLLVVGAVVAGLRVRADEGRHAGRAAEGVAEVIADEGADTVGAARVRRVQLGIEAVLREADVLAGSLQVGPEELDACVDAVVGRAVRREGARVAGVDPVESQAGRGRLIAPLRRARKPAVVEIDTDSAVSCSSKLRLKFVSRMDVVVDLGRC